MRADRLVAVLLMLQRRGRVTAREVADELEVSERTARRDLEALGVAGLPVYSVQGRHGGWRLAGGGRTDLSGLTAAEVRALFLAAGPAERSPTVKAALRKLVRALPEPLRDQAETAAASVVLDQAGWGRRHHDSPSPAHLETVQQAVVAGEQLRLGYAASDGAPSSRVVHPLGLASKGGRWYLVAGTERGLRTFRVDRINSADPTGEPVVRPAGFDLAEAWALVVDEVEERRLPVTARLVAEPDALVALRTVLGDRLRIGPPDEQGCVQAEARGWSARSLAGELAGFGSLVEVTAPDEVRAHLAAVGAQLVARYRG